MRKLRLFVLLAAALPAVLAAQETAPADTRPEVDYEAPAASEPEAGPLGTVPLAQAAPADEPTQLDEVVVTAQKTRQPLRKVPISVTAIGGDFIQDVGAADLADVSLYVPNVRVDADDLGSPQVFIRGFGTNAFNPSFESSVAFVQDELYFGRPGYFTESMFDVDRVEVLRGPQGTLFGKNSVAGVFNVVSRGPDEELAADARYFFGESNEHRIEAGAGGMFNDTFGGRVAALYRTQDGDLRNQFLNRGEEELEQKAGRIKLKLAALSGLESELTAALSDTQAPFWPFQLMKLDDDTRSYLEGFDPAIEDNPTDFVTSFDTPGFIEKGSDTGALKTTWRIGDLAALRDFESVLVVGASTFYIDQLNEIDVSPADIARLDNHEDHEQFSGELRFSANSESLFGIGTGFEFLAGGFFFDSNYVLLARVLAGRDLGSYLLTDDFLQLATQDNTATSPAGPLSGLPGLGGLGLVTGPIVDGDNYQFDYVQDIASRAFFGQFTWNLTESWALTSGVRVNREKKRVDSAGNANCAGRALGRPCAMEQLLMTQDYTRTNLERNESDVSPKVALQYFAAHGVNYYASWARGYKSGGFNSISFSGDDLEYQPESARTAEAGAKGRFLDGSLSLNLAAYETRFDNLQVLAFNGVFFDVSNAASARSRGLEADFQWITPWPALRLMGSAGLLDAKYLAYASAPAPISQGINENQDLAGRRIAFAPEVTATLTPTLTFFLGDYSTQFAVDVLHQGDQFTDTDLDPNTRVPAYTKYSGRLTLAPVAGRWSLSLGGTNLTDERVLNQVTDAPFFPGTYFAQQASGRQLFAVASLTF